MVSVLGLVIVLSTWLAIQDQQWKWALGSMVLGLGWLIFLFTLLTEIFPYHDPESQGVPV